MSTHNIHFYGRDDSNRWGDSNEYPHMLSTHNTFLMGEAILMRTHNICFYGEISTIIP